MRALRLLAMMAIGAAIIAGPMVGMGSEALVIGDRPGKDTVVAHAVGARAWRVRTGEYAHVPDEPPADLVLDDLRAVATALGLPA